MKCTNDASPALAASAPAQESLDDGLGGLFDDYLNRSTILSEKPTPTPTSAESLNPGASRQHAQACSSSH